jgi:hexosaminidase
MKYLFLTVFCLTSFVFKGQKPSIIPMPSKAEYPTGSYRLPASLTLSGPNDPTIQVAFKVFSEKLKKATGYKLTWIYKDQANANIRFVLNKLFDSSLGKEGYHLQVNKNGVQISANNPVGLFYGIQTLGQLLPKEIESKTFIAGISWKIPFADIQDTPRFAWRGMMFDVARHFFTKDQVKQFIDEMVAYKYNLLHLHLTDDEGWRIEIKSFPNLTKKGAFNVKKIGRFTEFSKPEPNEPRDFGGFFTQDDIRELVKYAKDRFVDIMPEIDVPGHSMAAVASYPELSCTPEAVNYQVISGEPFIDWSTDHAIALQDNTLCPANEKVYTFLDKVFGEVSELFPFEYIHMGGDECPKNYWDKNPQIQALRIKEGLANSQEVQAYFTRRLEKIITSKGKKMMGWDEILEGGGLPKNTAVMSWRGIKGGIQAANDGHQVVMTPNSNVYLDLMQGDGIIEPPVYETVRLKNSYDFNPVPEGINAALIKGGQVNLWSEQLFTYRHLQYMLYPRAWAVAEDLWSANENKNWNNFIGRVENHFERSDVAEIKYARSMYDPIFKFSKTAKGEIQVDLKAEVDNISFHYSFDHSLPDHYYPAALGIITVPKDAVEMRVISYRGKKPMGQMIRFPISDMLKRIK